MKNLNKQQKIGIGVLSAIFAVLLVMRLFVNTDERRIRNILQDFAASASTLAEAEPLGRVALLKQHAQQFADFVSVHLTSGEEQKEFQFTRAEFERNSIAAHSSIASLRVSLSDVTVHAEGTQATAHFEIEIAGALNGGEGEFLDNWSVMIGFVKIEGEWLIKNIVGNNLRPEPTMP